MGVGDPELKQLKARRRGAHGSLSGAMYIAFVSPRILLLANIRALTKPALARLLTQMREFVWSSHRRLMRADRLEHPLRCGGLFPSKSCSPGSASCRTRHAAAGRRQHLVARAHHRRAARAGARPARPSPVRPGPSLEAPVALRRARATRTNPSPAETALTPRRPCSSTAPVLWTLSGHQARAAEIAAHLGINAEWPPRRPAAGDWISRRDPAALGYDFLEVRHVTLRVHGYVHSISVQRVIHGGRDVDAAVIQLCRDASFTTAGPTHPSSSSKLWQT